MEQATRTILDEKYDDGRKEEALHVLYTWLKHQPNFEITPPIETRLQTASVDELNQWIERMVQGASPKSIFGPNGRP